MEETKRKVSIPEYLLWVKHWRAELNRPGRVEHYLMSLTKEIVHLQKIETGSGGIVQHDDMKLEFETPLDVKIPNRMSDEEVERMMEESKRRWTAFLQAPAEGNK